MTTGRNHRRRLWPLVAVVGIGMAFVGAGCMWGVVRDANTGAPVSGATVSYSDSQGRTGTATTDANGVYAFDWASGPIPAIGPITATVGATGYQTLSEPRQAGYDDNPNATFSNLSSFWEVQHFTLAPVGGPPPPLTADLAVTDLYPDTQPHGTLHARITNHGPNSVTNASVQLSCSTETTEYGKGVTKSYGSGPTVVIITVTLSPGQTQTASAGITLNTGTYWYRMTCTIQTPFNDPNPANDTYSETIPPPSGDLVLQDVFLGATTHEVTIRVAYSGPYSGQFRYLVQETSFSGCSVVADVPVPVGSQVFSTGCKVTGTQSIRVVLDYNDGFPETDEANNETTVTCSSASNTCW